MINQFFWDLDNFSIISYNTLTALSKANIGTWPNAAYNNEARPDLPRPFIVEIEENPRLKALFNIFKEGTLHASEVEDLSTNLPNPPRKLLEIGSKLGLAENETPEPVRFTRADPLGSESLLLRNLLDEKMDNDAENATETAKKYRLAQQIGQATSLTWSDKCRVMASITQGGIPFYQ